MKKLRILIFCLIGICHSGVAQTIEESTEYYICSAYSKFTDICLQDDKATSAATPFIYSYNKKSEDKNNSQLWTFIHASDTDSTLFYIKNSRTKLYLSATITMQGNSWRWGSYSKTSAKPFTLTDLGNGQFTLSALDEYGVRYYMHATDTTTTTPTFRNIRLCVNSRFAWYLQKYESPTIVHSLNNKKYQPNVSVLDHQIIVSNVPTYSIYNINGQEINAEKKVLPGIYIVKGNNFQRKVIVQ